MNVLTRTAFIGIIAVGMCFVIISGGIDLSVGSMAALIAGCMILLMNAHRCAGGLAAAGGRGSAWCSALRAGRGVRLAHGLLITKGRIEPFIVTLGTLGIFRAYLTYFANGGAITLDNTLVGRLQPGLLRQPAGRAHSRCGYLWWWRWLGGVILNRTRLRPLRAGHRLQRAGGALRRRGRGPRQDPDLHAARRVRGHRHPALRAAPGLRLAHHRACCGSWRPSPR